MKLKKFTLTIILLTLVFQLCGQTNNYTLNPAWGFAKSELVRALSTDPGHNVINNNKTIITDSTAAINVAEPILFSIYGKDIIIKQKPYSAFHIDNYWIIYGSMPSSYSENGDVTIISGGVFLIIFDDRNCKVLKITHGR